MKLLPLLILGFQFTAVAAPPETELLDIRNTTDGKDGFLITVVVDSLPQGTTKYVVRDEVGLGTLAFLNRALETRYTKAPQEEQKKWDTEIPNAKSLKGIFLNALKKAQATYRGAGEGDTADEAGKLIASLKDGEFTRKKLLAVTSFVEENIGAHSYSGRILRKGADAEPFDGFLFGKGLNEKDPLNPLARVFTKTNIQLAQPPEIKLSERAFDFYGPLARGSTRSKHSPTTHASSNGSL